MDHKQEQTSHNEVQNLIYRIIKKYDKRTKKKNLLHLLKQIQSSLNYIDILIKTILWIWKEDSTSRRDEQLSSSEKKWPRKKISLFWRRQDNKKSNLWFLEEKSYSF